MQLKILSRLTLLRTILTGFIALSPVLFLYFVFNGSIFNSSAVLIDNTVAFPNKELLNSGLSGSLVDKTMRLKIPKINVDSSLEYVGLDADGAMDVPKERANVAWFNLGPNPGNSGSAVIAGHYGRKDGKGSAFDDLHKLRKGDKLYIEDDKGVIVSFVVQGSRRYDSKADASGVFSSNDGKAHLNLVTCEGEWDELTKQYPRRLVVFTDREIE